MAEAILPTGEKVTYNRLGGTKENPVYYNDPAPVSTPTVTTPSPSQNNSTTKTTTDTTTKTGATGGTTAGSSTASPYYPRTEIKDAGMNTANAVLAPTTPRTEQQIYDENRKMRQGEIDAINAKFDSYISSQTQTNKESDAQANAVARASGLAGSPDAYTGIKKTADLGNMALDKINNERSAEIMDIFGKISSEAKATAKTESDNAKVAAKDYIANSAQKAQNAVKALAYKGIDPDTVKTSSPDDYQKLVDMYNGDENALRADYLANVPKDSVVGNPIISGKTVTYLTKDPKTGAIKSTTVDTGHDLTNGKDTSVHSIAGVGLAIVNKADGTAHIIGGTKPVTKGTTPKVTKPTVSGGLEYTPDTISQGTQFLEKGGQDSVTGQKYNGKGADGYVDPGAYLSLYQSWIDNKGLTQDFVKQYPPALYVNPAANSTLPKYLQNNKY